jgi:hypothetical protein
VDDAEERPCARGLGLARTAALWLRGIADARAWPDMAAGQSKIVELTNPQKSVYGRTH